MDQEVEKATLAERQDRKATGLQGCKQEDSRVAYHGRSAKPVIGKEDIMKTLTRFNKSIISTLSAIALAGVSGAWQIAAAGDMYLGTTTICAIDYANSTVEPGPGGFTYTSGVVMHYLIATDHELMNGPIAITSYSKLKETPRGMRGWYWGESTMVPDVVAGTGTLEETFKFKAQDADEIAGTLYGAGALEGVTVEFAETYDPDNVEQGYCDVYPECELPTCYKIAEDGEPGYTLPYVTLLEGVVFGYED